MGLFRDGRKDGECLEAIERVLFTRRGIEFSALVEKFDAGDWRSIELWARQKRCEGQALERLENSSNVSFGETSSTLR